MRICGAQGIHYPPRHERRRHPSAETDPNPDLVRRAFDPEGPDRLWVMDITEHSTTDGKVYLAVVVDAWARRVVGWSIADHLRAELVADAVQMATWRRRPPRGQVIAHSVLQRELLDQHHWTSRDQLAGAIFEWIECWYNPRRRHSYNDGLSPLDYETAHAA